MSEDDDATEMIYEHQDEQVALDTVNKLEKTYSKEILSNKDFKTAKEKILL